MSQISRDAVPGADERTRSTSRQEPTRAPTPPPLDQRPPSVEPSAAMTQMSASRAKATSSPSGDQVGCDVVLLRRGEPPRAGSVSIHDEDVIGARAPARERDLVRVGRPGWLDLEEQSGRRRCGSPSCVGEPSLPPAVRVHLVNRVVAVPGADECEVRPGFVVPSAPAQHRSRRARPTAPSERRSRHESGDGTQPATGSTPRNRRCISLSRARSQRSSRARSRRRPSRAGAPRARSRRRASAR